MTSPPTLDARRHGERRKFNRNRQIRYTSASFITDGHGNIVDRPMTAKLPCFADPIEWLFGRADQPRSFGDNAPEPRGCALCPVSGFCARVSWERIQSSPELIAAHDAWDAATMAVPPPHRFQHPTWVSLVDVCSTLQWSDPNEAKLELDREEKANAQSLSRKDASASRRKAKKRARIVPQAVELKIIEYRNARVQELTVQKLGPTPPLWIRNRTLERCILLADAWAVRERLEQGNHKASGLAVHDQLVAEGLIPKDPPKRMIKIIEEGLACVDKRIERNEWPAFEASDDLPAHRSNYGMHPSAVVCVLEP